MKQRIMVVDDDASIRDTFEHHLTRSGYEVSTAASAEQALENLAEVDPALVITDVRMPGMDGLELLGHLESRLSDLDVIVITAHEDMRGAMEAMKAGAQDYLVKPLDLDQLDMLVERCFKNRRLRRRVKHLEDEEADSYALDQLVGRDHRMIEISKLIGSLADNRAPVLVRGETGTGKELIARAIHFNSVSSEEPFVAVNCTALTETLLESELFGHVRGAFTGAVSDHRGRFELAGAGTIFLDEIADTSPQFQAKLLRVLEDHEFYPVGGERPRRNEARVIAATNAPVEERVAEGRLREDLYFRLKVVEVSVPPLRERRGDIPLLAEHLLARIARDLHRDVRLISEDALEALAAHDWPGNVRELENTLTRAAVTSRGPVITLEQLSLGEAGGLDAEPSPRGAADRSLDAVEREHVQRILDQTGGNKRQAARILEISRPRLDRLIARHGLTVTDRYQDGHGS
ncbi:MAG: sigma-54-dependent Fis family transcriptional regulator [Gemmatimonadetes bacterium]|nr:sigma-54-dependent Fis family transcriptional regulator [Gemmatimonadota bacterium]MCK5483130.1 sigma-54-dependent Fis family transcriptional regulator [Gemmatimonadota bacterium]